MHKIAVLSFDMEDNKFVIEQPQSSDYFVLFIFIDLAHAAPHEL